MDSVQYSLDVSSVCRAANELLENGFLELNIPKCVGLPVILCNINGPRWH
jgi:hypothetical protein